MNMVVFLLIYTALLFVIIQVLRSLLVPLKTSPLLSKEFKALSHLFAAAFFVILILLGVGYLGSEFNKIAEKGHNGKMPYDISTSPLSPAQREALIFLHKNDSLHKLYDPSKDRYYFFIDRFWKNERGDCPSYSIGDVLIGYSDSGIKLADKIFIWLMMPFGVLLAIEFVKARRKNI